MADKDFQVKNGIIVGGDAFISNSITSVNTISFLTGQEFTPGTGSLAWNEADGTVSIGLRNEVSLQVGQETHFYVKNQTGSTILNNTVVMSNGVVGASGVILVAPAIGDGSFPAEYVMGVATQDISNGEDGYVTSFGKVRGVDTSMFSEGDFLYLDPEVPGAMMNTAPVAPNVKATIAVVIVKHANVGEILVRPTFAVRMDQLQDVAILDGLADGESLVWVSANSRFENQTISGGAGDEANLYNTYTTLTANDYSTYTTLTANIYNTFEYLNANISTGTANLVSDQYVVTTSNIFTLTQSVVDANNILVSMDGIIQSPNDDYVVSGTTLNINNTVPIPSGTEVEVRHINGASITSGGGAASATWSIISSNTVLAANTNYFVDISLQPVTVTLPSSPTTGQTIRLIDMAGLAEANNITVTSIADKILRVNDNLLVNSNSAAFTLVYSNADYGWLLGEL